MRKKILHNWGLKLASLLLAAVLWFLVVQLDDPRKSQSFYNVPVTLINTELLEQEDKVYEILDNTDTVRVTVTAPTSIISQLRSTDIVAEADVSRLTDINTIPITYSVLNAGVDSGSIRGDHDVVRLSIEERDRKWVKVQYNTIGEVAEGYMVASASADQTLVEVTGPKSAVDQIDHAGVEIDVTGATSSLSANVDIALYDKEGQLLEASGVIKNVNYVHMSVEVLATKVVPIEVSAAGVPAKGFLYTGVVDCSPESVRVAGSVSALGNISKVTIPEEQMDLSEAQEDVVNVINIRSLLPDNIRLADSDFNGRVTVTAHVEPVAVRTLNIPAGNVSITNIPEGLTARLAGQGEDFEIKISGLAALVTPADPGMIAGTIDVKAWMEEEEIDSLTAGTYQIPVDYGIDEDIAVSGDVTADVTFSNVEE